MTRLVASRHSSLKVPKTGGSGRLRIVIAKRGSASMRVQGRSATKDTRNNNRSNSPTGSPEFGVPIRTSKVQGRPGNRRAGETKECGGTSKTATDHDSVILAGLLSATPPRAFSNRSGYRFGVENATKQVPRVAFRFRRIGTCSRAVLAAKLRTAKNSGPLIGASLHPKIRSRLLDHPIPGLDLPLRHIKLRQCHDGLLKRRPAQRRILRRQPRSQPRHARGSYLRSVPASRLAIVSFAPRPCVVTRGR